MAGGFPLNWPPTSGWFKEHYFGKGNMMTVDKVEDLERRLAKCQRRWMDSENRNIETTARLMLAQYEILRLEFGDDMEKDEPELYDNLVKLAKGE